MLKGKNLVSSEDISKVELMEIIDFAKEIYRVPDKFSHLCDGKLLGTRSRILAEATAQGEARRRAIINKAEAQALQIKAQAEIAAAQEAKQAIDAIRAELAEKITSAAEELVKKQLKKKDHEELVNEYLKKVVLN